MNGLLKIKVEESGFKKAYLAEQIGVKPNYFYMCMKGSRFLSKKKEDKLREILK